MNNQPFSDEEIILFIYKISRLVRKHVSDSPNRADEPSMLQAQVLMNLSNGPHTMTEIANELYIKLPTATSLINRLIEAGHVHRISDKKDRRITKIELTSKGKKMLTISMKAKMKKLQFLLDALSPSDKRTLFTIMKNLYTNLEINS